MAGDKLPSLFSLEKPDDLQALMRKDRGDDCLSCRIMGSGVFFGLAAYSWFSGSSQLEKQRRALRKSRAMFGLRSRKVGIAAISLSFFWMGLWRAFK